ncbi:hypothetical protein SAMN04488101_101378 [Pedobacter nyackensis]|uniref:Uncharacterized protein n=1 Tax=Pedobacter nyackensis TaxID=475255 RepID=A0A1W2AAK1_9SPHI|nr:hypothetical protein SAMN04488101_101378 [Pedobacter nyackensis]
MLAERLMWRDNTKFNASNTIAINQISLKLIDSKLLNANNQAGIDSKKGVASLFTGY